MVGKVGFFNFFWGEGEISENKKKGFLKISQLGYYYFSAAIKLLPLRNRMTLVDAQSSGKLTIKLDWEIMTQLG